MKAKLIKESLNEIKRNQEGSGLVAIGIGKVRTFHPLVDIMKELVDEQFDVVSGWNRNDTDEVSYTLKLQEDNNVFTMAPHGGDISKDVYLVCDLNNCIATWFVGKEKYPYENAIEFFKLWPDSTNLYKEFKDAVIEYFSEIGFYVEQS